MKRIIIAAMILCMLFINACSFLKSLNATSSDFVSNTASYYEGRFIVLADQYKNNKKYTFSDVTPQYIGDDYIAISVHAESIQANKTVVDELIEIYNYNEELILQTDLHILEPGKTFSEICMGTTKNGISLLLVDERSSYVAMYCIDFEAMEWQKKFELSKEKLKKGFSPDNIFEREESFILLYDWLDGSYYKSDVIEINFNGCIINDFEIDSVSSVYNANLWRENLIYQDDQMGFCCLDLTTGKSQHIEMNEDISKMYELLGHVAEDGKIYLKDGNEIKQYTIADKSEYTIQDLNYCNINMYSLYKGYLAYVGSEKTVLLDLRSSRNESPGRCKLIVLEKNDKNPYAGRKIMEIAMVWGITSVVGEAQQIYNQSKKDYFAYVSTRYDVRYFKLPDYYQSEPTLSDLVTLITDQLCIDIRNGNGPDIVIGLGDTNRLDKDDFLVDLYPYIHGYNGIDLSDYFENAFEAFAVEDHLYQIPLSVNVLGIMTDPSNVSEGQAGFSYSEYSKFVDDVCNGIDPISIGNNREQYFKYLFCSMHDQFITGNEIDVDNKAFRSLVEYAKNNISESGYQTNIKATGAKWVVLSNIYSDFVGDIWSEPSWDIYGAPSSVDRGPMITNFNTIAVTACTSNLNESWIFVKTSIGYDAQLAMKGDNPINRAAFYDYAKTAMNDANITFNDRNIPRVVDESDIYQYAHMLEKADCVAVCDTEVYKVIVEELQPYYLDEKSIESVIPIIQDRCQTILNER